MIDLDFLYKDAFAIILREAPFRPDLAVILGSGLGTFADSVETEKVIWSEDLPGYPPTTIPGHSGKIYFSRYAEKNLLLFKGRIHLYEGHKLSRCILPVFLSSRLGVKKIILTNAAGGVNPSFVPGDLMLADSFNGMFLKKEITSLTGLAGIKERDSLRDFPSAEMNDIIISAAETEGINLRRGVYWYTKGPSYETPAEIQMIKTFGGDAVGMSTVHEAVYAAYTGMKVSAISCITNYAAGISGEKLSHSEVTLTAKLVEEKFASLLKRIVEEI